MPDLSQPPFPERLSRVFLDMDETLTKTDDLIVGGFDRAAVRLR